MSQNCARQNCLKRGILLCGMLILSMTLLVGGNGCARYSLGAEKLGAMRNVRTLYIDVFENRTYYPRTEVLFGSSLAEQVAGDGSYKLASKDSADAVLRGKITSIGLRQIRSQKYNTYDSLQTQLTMDVYYEVVERGTGKILTSGSLTVDSDYFNQGNEQSTRWNALSFAARSAATSLVTRIAYGF